MSKHWLVGVALWATSSFAVNISGTSTISASAPDGSGNVQVEATVSLSCSLTCPPAAPTLHFAIAGLSDLVAVADPMVSLAYVSVGFAAGVDPSGTSTTVITGVPAGSSFHLINKSASCYCGGRTGEGGYVDVISNTISVPPFIPDLLLYSLGRVGAMAGAAVIASPAGSEVVTVTIRGAGVDQTLMLGAADFDSQHTNKVTFTPTTPGDVVVTATTAQSLSFSRTFTFTGSSSTGGGGGSSGTGGGSGGGDQPPAGCTQVPGALWSMAALALLRRRR